MELCKFNNGHQFFIRHFLTLPCVKKCRNNRGTFLFCQRLCHNVRVITKSFFSVLPVSLPVHRFAVVLKKPLFAGPARFALSLFGNFRAGGDIERWRWPARIWRHRMQGSQWEGTGQN
jgi:hypothetical protein